MGEKGVKKIFIKCAKISDGLASTAFQALAKILLNHSQISLLHQYFSGSYFSKILQRKKIKKIASLRETFFLVIVLNG